MHLDTKYLTIVEKKTTFIALHISYVSSKASGKNSKGKYIGR